MLRYLVTGLVLVVALGAAERQPRSARLVGKAPTLVAGRPWTATVRLTPPARAPKLTARMGARTVRFPARRIGHVVYRAVVRLAAGSWRLSLEVGSRRLPLATVRVAPAAPG